MADRDQKDIEHFSEMLREELLDISGLVIDATWNAFWNDDLSNAQIRRKIDALIQNCNEDLPRFSMNLVKRHGDCGHRDHRKVQNYVFEVIGDDTLSMSENDWLKSKKLAMSFWAGDECSCCPCYKSGKKTDHYVLYDIVTFDKNPSPRQRSIASVLDHLYEARDRSANGRPRSGIREQLLLGVFAIDAARNSDG